MTQLILIRGIPGSGKSTLAKHLKSALGSQITVHLEADMFFMKDDVYEFDVNKLHAAHQWCQTETDNALFYKQDVIVSNTFTTIKELKPYFEIARYHGIIPIVYTCNNMFKNVHNVPEENMKRMRERFKPDLSELYENNPN